MTQIVMKMNNRLREAHLKREFEMSMKNRKPDTDLEGHFKGMSYVGKALWNIYQFDANKRAKALENKAIDKFMLEFFRACEMWAKEHQYRWEDIFVKDASITDNGILLIQIAPKPGAMKIGQDL